MEMTECSEMSAHTIQTLGNLPKERIQPTGNTITEETILTFCILWAKKIKKKLIWRSH